MAVFDLLDGTASGTSCSDENACNGEESCTAAGACVAGGAPSVDDQNPCTTDSCSPSNGVTHTPVPAGTSCADSNQCNGAETCNASAACTSGTPPATDDGNPCTADSCDPATGVIHTPVSAGTACADSDTCNGAETHARANAGEQRHVLQQRTVADAELREVGRTRAVQRNQRRHRHEMALQHRTGAGTPTRRVSSGA